MLQILSIGLIGTWGDGTEKIGVKDRIHRIDQNKENES